MSKRPKQVSMFFDAAHSMSLEIIDFQICFSPGFVMQLKQARQESFRCIAGLNLALASILL